MPLIAKTKYVHMKGLGLQEKKIKFQHYLCVLMCFTLLPLICINLLSPNSDQYQTSPRNINISSREKVMRINKMITKGKLLYWSFLQILPTYTIRNVVRSVWRICMLILELKELFYNC